MQLSNFVTLLIMLFADQLFFVVILLFITEKNVKIARLKSLNIMERFDEFIKKKEVLRDVFFLFILEN